jgi:hypothetical protein
MSTKADATREAKQLVQIAAAALKHADQLTDGREPDLDAKDRVLGSVARLWDVIPANDPIWAITHDILVMVEFADADPVTAVDQPPRIHHPIRRLRGY